MRGAWRGRCLLLLTVAALCSGRNAAEFFRQAGFRRAPARPEDAFVLSVAGVPPLTCEPHGGACRGVHPSSDFFCLSLPHGYSFYKCWFEGNSTVSDNLDLVEDTLLDGFSSVTGGLVVLGKGDMSCSSSSQLPDEYFHLRVRRPLDDGPLRCRVSSTFGLVFLEFPGFPTVACQAGVGAGRHNFRLPCIDERLKCAFRVYSELPLGDTKAEERLYESLIGGLACGEHDRPRVVCSPHGSSNGTAHFLLKLELGGTFHCNFPDAPPRHLPETSP